MSKAGLIVIHPAGKSIDAVTDAVKFLQSSGYDVLYADPTYLSVIPAAPSQRERIAARFTAIYLAKGEAAIDAATYGLFDADTFITMLNK